MNLPPMNIQQAAARPGSLGVRSRNTMLPDAAIDQTFMRPPMNIQQAAARPGSLGVRSRNTMLPDAAIDQTFMRPPMNIQQAAARPGSLGVRSRNTMLPDAAIDQTFMRPPVTSQLGNTGNRASSNTPGVDFQTAYSNLLRNKPTDTRITRGLKNITKAGDKLPSPLEVAGGILSLPVQGIQFFN